MSPMLAPASSSALDERSICAFNFRCLAWMGLPRMVMFLPFFFSPLCFFFCIFIFILFLYFFRFFVLLFFFFFGFFFFFFFPIVFFFSCIGLLNVMFIFSLIGNGVLQPCPHDPQRPRRRQDGAGEPV